MPLLHLRVEFSICKIMNFWKSYNEGTFDFLCLHYQHTFRFIFHNICCIYRQICRNNRLLICFLNAECMLLCQVEIRPWNCLDLTMSWWHTSPSIWIWDQPPLFILHSLYVIFINELVCCVWMRGIRSRTRRQRRSVLALRCVYWAASALWPLHTNGRTLTRQRSASVLIHAAVCTPT